MTWLRKLFGKSHDKINVSEANDRKEKCSSAQSRSRKKPNRRGRTNSVVMRQKMQKKIAESAKERVLDKRRAQKVNLQWDQVFEREFHHSDIVDTGESSRFDFRADLPVRSRKNNLVTELADRNRGDQRRWSGDQTDHDSAPTKSGQPHDEASGLVDGDQSASKETNQISSETNSKLNDLNGLVHSYWLSSTLSAFCVLFVCAKEESVFFFGEFFVILESSHDSQLLFYWKAGGF